MPRRMHDVPAFKHPRVMHWDDERNIGNSLIVTLTYGWAFKPSADEATAVHVQGFDTKAEAIKAVRNAKQCPCPHCKDTFGDARKPCFMQATDTGYSCKQCGVSWVAPADKPSCYREG